MLQASAPQSVDRIFSILDHVSVSRDGVGLSALARSVAAPKSSLVNLLAGMTRSGQLSCDDRGLYQLGPAMVSLALRIAASSDVTAVAKPLLARLAKECGETVLLGQLAEGEYLATYTAKAESENVVRYTVPIGTKRPLHCTAIGKLLLAYMEPHSLREYLSKSNLGRFTDGTLTTAKQLREEIDRVRAAGIAESHRESVNIASALAVPVFDHEGRFKCGIVAAGPAERIEANWAAVRCLARQTAASLTRQLGGKASAQEA